MSVNVSEKALLMIRLSITGLTYLWTCIANNDIFEDNQGHLNLANHNLKASQHIETMIF